MSKNREAYLTRHSEEVRRSKDQRASPRYSPSGNPTVSLSWQEGEETRSTRAVIVNLSMTGALLKVETFPKVNEPVKIRMEEPVQTEWLEATVLKVERSWFRRKTARIMFRDNCSYELFTAAVNGFAGNDGFMTLPQDLKNPKHW